MSLEGAIMAVNETGKCQACGKKISKERSTDAGAPKLGYECSKCHQWVCGDCTDWNASEAKQHVCSRCAGRTAPHKCGCD
jgi:hypothetical protein